MEIPTVPVPQTMQTQQSSSLWNWLSDTYTDVLVNKRDARTDGYPLMSSPLPTLLLCVGYVLLVKVVGPWWMAGRAPYSFRKTLVAYNGAQVVFSAWLFYEYGMGGWFNRYNFTCQPVDYSTTDPVALRMVNVCWFYFFSKFTEFADTFFFVLRKKDAHISALHVIHHGIMPMSVWFGVKLTPGGHSTFFGLLNTFVHVIMYFYYMVAAMGPQYSKFLWWKKYLTSIQMVQFVGIAGHSFQLLFRECDYPRAFVWWIGCHGLLFLVLFSNFYRREYLLKRKIASEKKKLELLHQNATAMQHEESIKSNDDNCDDDGMVVVLRRHVQSRRVATTEKSIQ